MAIRQAALGVVTDFKNFFWPRKHWLKVVRLGAVALLLLVGARFFGPTNDIEEPPATTDRAVTLVSANEVSAAQTGTFVGVVRAVSEAQIQNEVAGRVTSVTVRPGDQVAAGAIIATLENSAQAAAVLQAEGAYEQAVANAAISGVTVQGALSSRAQAVDQVIITATAARSTINSLYNGALDELLADQGNVYRTGSVLLRDDAVHIYAAERNYNQLPSLLAQVQTQLAQPASPAHAQELIAAIRSALAAVDTITESLRTLATDDDLSEQFDAEAASFFTTLDSVETQANTIRGNIRTVEGQLQAAEEALSKAELSASSETVSVADAQVKSALGSLRAAQAQLAKTILRTPIAGTVNNVSVNTGDFVGAFTPLAEVANNGSLEISFFVTETEAAALALGQSLRVGQNATGTIVSIAPAVSQTTQKTEVRAAVSDESTLTNGSSVLVTPVSDTTASTGSVDQTIRLPLTAVRFTASDGSVFVVENDTLVMRPVTLGPVQGSSIVIASGLSADDKVVADARGLTEGQKVTIENN